MAHSDYLCLTAPLNSRPSGHTTRTIFFFFFCTRVYAFKHFTIHYLILFSVVEFNCFRDVFSLSPKVLQVLYRDALASQILFELRLYQNGK